MKLNFNKKIAVVLAGLMSFSVLPVAASNDGMLALHLEQKVTSLDATKLTSSLGLPEVSVIASESLDQCLAYGSHIVDLAENKISWNLYNGKDLQANAEKMTFTWPERLGQVRSIKFNGSTVYWSLFSRQNGELTLDARKLPSDVNLDGFESATVEVSFSRFGTEKYKQTDFSMDVQFEENCDRNLAKGGDTQADEGNSNSYLANYSVENELHDKGINGKNVILTATDRGRWAGDKALWKNTANNKRM